MVSSSLISRLRKIATPLQEEVIEKCDFCGRILSPNHRHLVDLSAMKFMCTCEMCMITMAEAGTYKPLPQRSLRLEGFNMSDALWSDFLIPVNMAFFVLSSGRNGAVAYYPAPTGATESKLKMEAWYQLTQINPLLNSLAPDLEALLINRLDTIGQYYIVPIDKCYELIGRIRITWKGIFGGKEVNDVIRQFFEELKEKSVVCPI
ncbi:MAG: DUF5947 family protein [Chitinophagaceae bacterium]